MGIQLTEQQRKTAEKLIERKEQEARTWPWARWLFVMPTILGVLWIHLGFKSYAMAISWRSMATVHDDDPSAAVAMVDMRFLEMALKEQAQAVGLILFGIVVAVWSVVAFFRTWPRQKRASLEAALLRAQMEALSRETDGGDDDSADA